MLKILYTGKSRLVLEAVILYDGYKLELEISRNIDLKRIIKTRNKELYTVRVVDLLMSFPSEVSD